MASPGSLVGRTLGRYRILGGIGAGGMGEVYRARDLQLEREIALKLLPPATLGDDIARARLLREARSAAALNHPHICTVHEVGEADGQIFIAMELIEGQALSQVIPPAGLDLDTVLRYGAQVADALEHAHRHGIVHRDLKSSNIALAGERRVKVVDFGLAKRLAGESCGERTTDSMASLSEPGAVLGTLAYMAPEQLRGQPADARSDIWALGVVLYEMTAGRLPFRGPTGFGVSAAILNDPPPSLPGRTPLPLRAIVERCLAKSPQQRYQSAAEVGAALEALRAGTSTPGMAWRYWLRRRAWVVVLALLLLLAGAGLFRWRGRLAGAPAPIRSLAVLPLENISGDAAQDYFAAGIHESLITDLTKLAGLKVISRSSVLRYGKLDKPLAQVARELGVDALVTGAVVKSGDRLQITAHLIDPATEQQLWGDRYERQLRDLLTLQNEIVTAITRQIRLQLSATEQQRLAQPRHLDPEVYDAYLNGRFYAVTQRNREGLDNAERYFRLALKKDPDYAPAHWGIGKVAYERADVGLVNPQTVMPMAKAQFVKALALDDSFPDAHVWLAILYWTYEADIAAAEQHYRRALELDPNNAAARFQYADFLVSTRRFAEWQAESSRALELDPPNLMHRVFYGWHLVYLQRYPEAIAVLHQVAAMQPDEASAYMGLWGAFYKQGNDDEAYAAARQFYTVLRDAETLSALERGHARGGYRGAMQQAGDALARRAQASYVSGIRIARLYAHAGNHDAALAWLERAYARHEVNLIHLGVGWDWDGLRAEPRFQELLRRLHLPG